MSRNKKGKEALKAGVATIAGGGAGYAVTAGTGLTAVGAIGGGAGIGTAAGPVGAIAGAVVGLAGYGLFNSSDDNAKIIQAVVNEALDLIADTAVDTFAKTGEFTIPGIGKIVRKRREVRTARNPQTGSAIKIPAKTVAEFQIDDTLKDAILSDHVTVDEIFKLIASTAVVAIKMKGEFTIRGIGKLVKQRREARSGRNPQTGVDINISEKTVVKFRLAEAFKDAISDENDDD
jgi:DNA-binding protein HU-beta